MSVPTVQQDGVFTHVYPVEDLGLVATYAASTSGLNYDGTVFSTGMPATVLVLTKLSAGSGTLKIAVAASGVTPDFSSPAVTLSLTGTSMQVANTNTAFTYSDSSGSTTTISVDQRFVGIRLTPGGTGMTISQMAVLVIYELTPGEDWFLGLRGSANAVANRTVGDGSGVLALTPAYADNPNLNANLKL